MATGKDIVEMAQTKLGQEYFFGAAVPLNDREYEGPWDCAELCSWAVYQAAEITYGCVDNYADPAEADAYTGAWKDDADRLGIIISLSDAARTPGAMLLRRSQRSGHIAISVGNGKNTIEARAELYGVLVDDIAGRNWETGVLVPGISYEIVDIQTNAFDVQHRVVVLKNREQTTATLSPVIVKLQERLVALGYLEASEISGRFLLSTELAVRDFQLSVGLTPDGEVDALVASKLELEWPLE